MSHGPQTKSEKDDGADDERDAADDLIEAGIDDVLRKVGEVLEPS